MAVDTLELLRTNLLSPTVLAFALGITATLVKSDLKIPDALYTTLSIYLLLAIGLKGGRPLPPPPFPCCGNPPWLRWPWVCSPRCSPTPPCDAWGALMC